jgi:hypothetical protein
MHRVARDYETTYFKLSPATYDKMMTAVQECDKQLKMDNEVIKKCVSRRINRQPDKKKQDKKKSRTRRQAPDASTTAAPPPVVIDEENPETTTPLPPGEEPVKSWKEVLRYERTTVFCYVNEMRKTELKDVPRKEWRQVRDQKIADLAKQKADCMKKQLITAP